MMKNDGLQNWRLLGSWKGQPQTHFKLGEKKSLSSEKMTDFKFCRPWLPPMMS